MNNKRVSVIIPAYNEEERIEDTLKALVGIRGIDEIIVVDDCSTDNTPLVVSNFDVRLIQMAKNSGKGAALERGLQEAQGEIIGFLDADLGCSAADIVFLLEPVVQGFFDMTIAQFPPAKRKGGFGLVKNLARFGIKKLAGLEVKSPLSGQRVMTRELLEYLGEIEAGYGVEVGLTIDAVRGGFRVCEVPTRMTHHETGRDIKGFIHRGKQFVHVFKVLCNRMIRR